MQKRISKLRVSRETLRNLSERELRGAAGGICTAAPCGYATVSKTQPNSCSDDCCTNECTVGCEVCTGIHC